MLPKMVKIDNKIVKCYQKWQHVTKYRNKMVTNWQDVTKHSIKMITKW